VFADVFSPSDDDVPAVTPPCRKKKRIETDVLNPYNPFVPPVHPPSPLLPSLISNVLDDTSSSCDLRTVPVLMITIILLEQVRCYEKKTSLLTCKRKRRWYHRVRHTSMRATDVYLTVLEEKTGVQ
jgi:hypothetical protein